jgi:hypothetical protein
LHSRPINKLTISKLCSDNISAEARISKLSASAAICKYSISAEATAYTLRG